MRLTNPTGRQTQAHILYTSAGKYYFSYETCIAAVLPCGDSIRIANSWGPTTTRHFNELGCSDFEIVPTSEFNARIAGQRI